jgi:hypothetical protein
VIGGSISVRQGQGPGLRWIELMLHTTYVLFQVVIKTLHFNSGSNLKGGGQLSVKTGSGEQMRGMVSGLGQ